MLKSKSRIALALVFAMTAAAPAFALQLNGSQWLTMMQQVRTDKADEGAPLWVSVRVINADVPGWTLTFSQRAIPKIGMSSQTMTFPVTDATHLSMLRKGDWVEIEVAKAKGVVRIIDIHMRH
jgi:Cu/Ag efflux protein CusF